jgi:hypothetical protein
VFRLQDVGRIDQETFRALWREFQTATTWQRQVCSPASNRRISGEKVAQVMDVTEEQLSALLALT